MIKAYICHPYSNDPEGNIEKVKEICKEIAESSMGMMDLELEIYDNLSGASPYQCYQPGEPVVVPVAAHLLFPKFMSEDGGVSRNVAMAFCLSLLSGCDELWVCSDLVTEGMKLEIEYASNWGMKIVFYR